jgi:hypothetical protein
MPPLSEAIQCAYCSQSITTNVYQCSHCLMTSCYQCLIKHHHHDVKNEFMDMIKQIDEILARFLHHAHNQTEWTDHLTEDRKRLEIFIEIIADYYPYLPIPTLPDFQWVNHVKFLIRKNSYEINENCCKLMYPSLNSSFKS